MAWVGMAARRCAISDSDTIETSSTITRSWGNGLSGPCMNPAPRRPSRRWTVTASSDWSWATTGTGRWSASVPTAWRMASVMRAAAFPVGATRAIRSPGDLRESSGVASSGPFEFTAAPSRAHIRPASRWATVVVLPVPGPPAITTRPLSATAAAAATWSGSGREPVGTESSSKSLAMEALVTSAVESEADSLRPARARPARSAAT